MRKVAAAPLAVLVALALVAWTSPCCGLTVIDLTYQLKEGESITWPTNPKYNFTILTRGHSPLFPGVWFENNKIETSEHLGTHMDAPAHFVKGKWRMHEIPPSHLVGPGVVIDITEKVKRNPVYSLTLQDVKEWESQHGRMARKAVVLVRSGWGKRYPVWNRVFNTENINDPSSFKFPSVTTEAASWLAENRDIMALGIDTPTPDLGREKRFPVHKMLLANDILILENVAHMDKLPAKGTTIIMGAINIYDGSGGPMRLLALKDMGCECEGSEGSNDSSKPQISALCLVAVVLGLSMTRLFQ